MNSNYNVYRKEVVRIVNAKQAALYIKHGAKLVDVYCGYQNTLVCVFEKESTQDLFDRWVKHELD